MKKLSKILAALAATAALAGFVSCSGGDDANPFMYYNAKKTSTLKYLDLSNAKSLYISGGSGTSANKAANISANASGSNAQKMFKITEDGYVEEVKYLDENKNEISISKKPTAIHPINDDYFCVGFGWSIGYMNSCYLVRKSDGAVFDMKNAGIPDYVPFETWIKSPIRIDKNNNIYYRTGDQLIRVDLNGMDSLAGTIISPSTDFINAFDVDKDGNIIYDGSSNESGYFFTRIRKFNGELKNISYVDSFWIGLDGCIYYNKYNGEHILGIKKLSIDAEGNIFESDYGANTGIRFSQSSSYKFDMKNHIIIVDGNYRYGQIYDVYNSSSNPRTVSLAGLVLHSVLDVASTENFYYIAGTDSSDNTILIKVNPEDDSWTNLLPNNNYEVYTFTASETDGITFNALRMSDGKKIIGKVGINGGAVTVIDEESDAQISYLERIN